MILTEIMVVHSRMCDILHLRHTKVWLRPDFLFNMTNYAKDQVKLLDFIHGLTINVSWTRLWWRIYLGLCHILRKNLKDTNCDFQQSSNTHALAVTLLLKMAELSGFVEEGRIQQNLKTILFLPRLLRPCQCDCGRMISRRVVDFSQQKCKNLLEKDQVFSCFLETWI